MEKFLVTGGAGFIGSHIVKRLIEKQCQITVVDNLSTGTLKNLEGMLDSIEFIEGDLTDMELVKRVVSGKTHIIHQAAIPSVSQSIQDPIGSNDSIIKTTLNLLYAAANEKSVKRFVQASSSAVYGNMSIIPQREEMQCEPLSPYGVAKYTQELYGKVFSNIYGLEVVSLRYFNVYGDKQKVSSIDSAVIPVFLEKMKNGERPIINGDGMISRDFVSVEDVANANILACHMPWCQESQVLNIGSGVSTTLFELMDIINKILKCNIEPIIGERREGDIQDSLADISKAEKYLHYHSQINLEEGLSKLI